MHTYEHQPQYTSKMLNYGSSFLSIFLDKKKRHVKVEILGLKRHRFELFLLTGCVFIMKITKKDENKNLGQSIEYDT